MNDDIKVLRELSLPEQLGRLSRLWRTAADKELAPLQLTYSRWTALWKLKCLNDNISQKTLADSLEIELASLMRTLKQLEEQELIVRRSSDKDKRVRIVTLTAQGHAVICKIEAHIMQVRRDLLAGIDEAEISQFKNVIERIAGNALHRLNDTETQ
ncbi:MarR family transcriptional regulator [Psychromonas aquimarina]|uniref:MarR family transcriptional regulator n=1 Tax=Psychromonas aquimarina TaxID=444919 RepID=UPI0003F7576B|nr:MarR family transcriptional regulator [Psychromonas aquimarina]